MNSIPQDVAVEIGSLALCFDSIDYFKSSYEVSVGGTTIYRDFEHSDLLSSIMLVEKEGLTHTKKGVHINVMNNGDVFARAFPYYDGCLEIIPIWNQGKIFELINPFLKK